MTVFAGPVQRKKIYPLQEKGEYVFTLLDLTFEQGGTYGDSLLWKWMISPISDPTNYIPRDDGLEKTIHEYTTPDVILGSKPHEWIGALTGNVLEDGQDPPDSDDLVGQRMVAYLAHIAPKQGPNAGNLKERISQGTAKRFNLPGQKPAAKAAPVTQVSADPTEEDLDRALIVSKLQKKIARAVKLDTPSSDGWSKFSSEDFADADMAVLEKFLAEATDEVNAALED